MSIIVELTPFAEYVHRVFLKKIHMSRHYKISGQLGVKWLQKDDLFISPEGDVYKKLKIGDGIPYIKESKVLPHEQYDD